MMGGVLFGYLLRLGLIFLAVWLVQDAAWISLPGARSDHHRHAPRAPGVGAEVRRDLARLSRASSRRPPTVAPTDTVRTITTSPHLRQTDTCSHSNSRRSTR